MNYSSIKSFHDLAVGDVWEEHFEITEHLVEDFIHLTGDTAPIHVDEKHALSMGYDRPIVHGLLVTSLFSRILGMNLPGPNSVIHQLKTEMKRPTYIGDKLNYFVEVTRVSSSVKSVVLSLKITNDHGDIVNTGEATCIYRR